MKWTAMPKTSQKFEKTKGYKLRLEERFIQWAKIFQNKEIDLESISTHQDLFNEFKKKWDDYGIRQVKKRDEALNI